MENRDIVIVGAGPGGVATALWLDKIAPELAERALILDAKKHPREKVCAGCLTGRAVKIFKEIGVELKVPNVELYKARFRTAWGDLAVGASSIFGSVVRREEFDASALAVVNEREIEVREGTTVTGISRVGDRVVLETDKGRISAKAVVGADGVGSLIRRSLTHEKNTTLLIQAELPVEKDHPAHSDAVMDFDFRRVPLGRKGYRWTFPYLKDGVEHVNVGICEWNDGSSTALREDLIEYMKNEDLDPDKARFRFHPERSFVPDTPMSAPGVLLVGDAVGIDPFLGEGLSYSAEYGMLAAQALVAAFQENDFSFKEYAHKVTKSTLGRTLYILHLLAKYFYSPLHEKLVRKGLMDPGIYQEVGDFLAGRVKPSIGIIFRIAYRLSANILAPSNI